MSISVKDLDNPNFVFPEDAVLPDVKASVGVVASGSEVEEFEVEQVKRWGVHGVYELAGQSPATNVNCGRFRGYEGCVRTDLHNIVRLDDGVNYAGKVYVRLVFGSCDNPRCEICFRSWAVREADKIEQRVVFASKQFGQAEHFVLSVPKCDYGLGYEQLHARAVKVLKARGVIGGVLVPHAFRYADFRESQRRHVPFGWYFSFHWHVIGFIVGGYSKCRRCDKLGDYGKPSEVNCAGCSGFENVTREQFKKDSYICKVAEDVKTHKQGVRKSVFGTAFYELQHCSVRVDVPRSHVVSWFGVCGVRKMVFTPEKRKRLCPVCQHDCVRLLYFGGLNFEKDSKSPNFQRDLWLPMSEGMGDCWVEWVGKPFG